MGYEIIIASGRFDPNLDGIGSMQFQVSVIQNFLDNNDIPYDKFCAKPFNAVAFIDDRGVSANKSWEEILNDIKNLSKVAKK